MWQTKTCGVTSSVENFAQVSYVHYQQKTIAIRGSDGSSTKAKPQYGCYTFAFYPNAPSPVAASKNKWPGDWASYWFYHKVPLDPAPKRHPLMVKKIGNLGESPKVKVECSPENEM